MLRQTATTRARVRTAAQLQRQDAAYSKHIQGMPVRAIARELHASPNTIVKDISEERKLRASELGADKEARIADAIAGYRLTIQRMRVFETDPELGPRAAAEITRAQERIDKMLGLDQPTTIDIRAMSIDAKLDQLTVEELRALAHGR